MSSIVVKIEFVAGAALLLAIVVLVFIAALMRFLGDPLIWSVDLAQLLFIWLCFVGAARTMRLKGHIGVDLAVRMLGYRYRLWLETAQAVIFVAFLMVLTLEGYKLAVANKERVFGYSGMSYAWVTIAVSFGSIMLSLAIVANAVDAWRKRASREKLIFSQVDAEPTITEL
ncbi:MAG: TRAP transporter small permease subunit [Salaquimonas sp.]|nr:TRAP transporter small permease subunit [Salaquimonas sp.]